MFEIPTKELRTPRSFTMLPSTIKRVEELARVYDTNASRIVEGLIVNYGPKLIEQARKNKPTNT